MKELNSPKDVIEAEEEKARRFLTIVIIVAIMLIMILTFGWFYLKEKEREKDQEELKRQEEELRKQEEKERKRKRLAEVEARILKLQAIKDKIRRRERNIIIWIRVGVGALLISVNYLYIDENILKFNFENDIGKLLNLNAAILMGYSFVAFISYGTINNFVKRMKNILSQQLKKNHLHSLAELESLIREREKLVEEIQKP